MMVMVFMLTMMETAMMLKVMMVRTVKVMMMMAMIAIVRISPNVHSAGRRPAVCERVPSLTRSATNPPSTHFAFRTW